MAKYNPNDHYHQILIKQHGFEKAMKIIKKIGSKPMLSRFLKERKQNNQHGWKEQSVNKFQTDEHNEHDQT